MLYFLLLLFYCLLVKIDSFLVIRSRKSCHDRKLWTWLASTSNRRLNEGLPPLDKAGGIVYRTSVLTKHEFETIVTEVSNQFSAHLEPESSSSVARHRVGVSLPVDCETVRILQDGSLRTLVQQLAGDNSYRLVLGDTSPCESNIRTNKHSKNHRNRCIPSPRPVLPSVDLRVYERVGSGMPWHVDDVLVDPPQIEIVLTLENTSDCVTLWKTKNGIQSVETDPNSAIILRAGGSEHCVTSLKQGRRAILKCVFAQQNGVPLARYEGVEATSPQFGSINKLKRRR